MFKNAD